MCHIGIIAIYTQILGTPQIDLSDLIFRRRELFTITTYEYQYNMSAS